MSADDNRFSQTRWYPKTNPKLLKKTRALQKTESEEFRFVVDESQIHYSFLFLGSWELGSWGVGELGVEKFGSWGVAEDGS
jgi:hypothetical protein